MLCTSVYLDNQLTVFINLQFCLLSPLWTSYYSKQNFNCSYIFKFSWLVYIIKRGIFFPMNGSEGKKAKTKMSNAEYRSCGFYQDFPSASTFVFFRAFLGTNYHISWKKGDGTLCLVVPTSAAYPPEYQNILFAFRRIWPAYG